MRRLLSGLLTLTAGCGSNKGASSDGATTVDSAGIAIVTNRTPAWGRGEGWRVDSVPITSIGANESDTNQQFRWVMPAVRLTDGSVALATDGPVKLFGPSGIFLRNVVRTGMGPGEFRWVSSLHRLSGDTLRISAAGGVGIHAALFAPDGKLVREERPDMKKFRKLGRWRECLMEYLPDGSITSCQSDSTLPATETNRAELPIGEGMMSPGPGLLRQLNRTYLVPPSLDTALPLSVGAGIEQFGVKLSGSNMAFIQHAFYSRALLATGGSPMRIATMLNPAYEIAVWTPAGKLDRIIRRTGGRRPPTGAEVSDARLLITAEVARNQFDAVTAARVAAAVPDPDSLPAGIQLRISSEGEIIVQRDGLLKSQSHSHFDIFDSTGRWQGELSLPPRTRLLEVGKDYLLAVRFDADDRPVVEVYRLTR